MPTSTDLFREALRFATPSVRVVASDAGYAHVTFDKYLNQRSPSRKAVLALAEALEERSRRLSDLAARLRESNSANRA